MHRQILVIIDGLNGAGKTTVSRLLHKKLDGTALLSFDRTKRLVSNFHPNDEHHSLANRILKAMTKEYLASGYSVIIESIFPDKKFLLPYLSLARQKKIAAHVYQLEAPLEIRRARIRQRPLVQGAKKKMTKKWIKRNDSAYLKNKYQKGKVIDSGDRTPQQIVKTILKDLHQ